MTEEPQDCADHLVAAARIGSREGMTREEFLNAAGVFWDSWGKFREFSSQRRSALRKPDLVGTGVQKGLLRDHE